MQPAREQQRLRADLPAAQAGVRPPKPPDSTAAQAPLCCLSLCSPLHTQGLGGEGAAVPVNLIPGCSHCTMFTHLPATSRPAWPTSCAALTAALLQRPTARLRSPCTLAASLLLLLAGWLSPWLLLMLPGCCFGGWAPKRAARCLGRLAVTCLLPPAYLAAAGVGPVAVEGKGWPNTRSPPTTGAPSAEPARPAMGSGASAGLGPAPTAAACLPACLPACQMLLSWLARCSQPRQAWGGPTAAGADPARWWWKRWPSAQAWGVEPPSPAVAGCQASRVPSCPKGRRRDGPPMAQAMALRCTALPPHTACLQLLPVATCT